MSKLRSVGILVLLSITAACGGSSTGSAAPAENRVAETTGTTAVAADGIWVGAGRSTVRIDHTTMQAATTVASGPGRNGDIAVDGDVLWIRNADWLLRQAATTGTTVAEEITADTTSGGSVLVAFGAVWATANDDAAVFKISA